MTKRFCNLCGEPAVDDADFLGYVTPKDDRGSITFRVSFEWNFHTTTNTMGDTYHLCACCREKCLEQVPNQLHALLRGEIRMV